MALTDTLKIEILEREIIRATITVVDKISGVRDLFGLRDVANDVEDAPNGNILIKESGVWVDKTVSVIIDTYKVDNETPVNVSALPSKRFSTEFAYRSATLQIFLNGLKIHTSEVVQHSDTEFSYPIDIIAPDVIEISYIKKA